jgi:hypothetical protein
MLKAGQSQSVRRKLTFFNSWIEIGKDSLVAIGGSALQGFLEKTYRDLGFDSAQPTVTPLSPR